ncbi:MAG: hypothetical protein E5Y63_26145 [Mesorhizobium sp.]|nr:MAG: hypothetical protein EOR04_12525 [Mesorhizobium sp.]TIM27032.1 MAG: hypothetical protein E5Y63_26145 [Mesorhizobium sp.]
MAHQNRAAAGWAALLLVRLCAPIDSSPQARAHKDSSARANDRNGSGSGCSVLGWIGGAAPGSLQSLSMPTGILAYRPPD